MLKMDFDRDGKISFTDYCKAVIKNPSMMEFLGQCLPDRLAVYRMLTTFTITKKPYGMQYRQNKDKFQKI